MAELPSLIAAVVTALDETEREYAQLPFFVRPLVKRGFARRTGRDFAAWRALLAELRRGQRKGEATGALAALAEQYRGAPERAKRGMGASAAEITEIEKRSAARAAAAVALREALLGAVP